jgi:uncharacterized protein with ParB-like and HNH nuclease domain
MPTALDSKLTKEVRSLGQLFQGDTVYRIPRFQRPYSWSNDELEDYYDDICKSIENEEDYYYFGSMVLSHQKQ